MDKNCTFKLRKYNMFGVRIGRTSGEIFKGLSLWLDEAGLTDIVLYNSRGGNDVHYKGSGAAFIAKRYYEELTNLLENKSSDKKGKSSL